MATETGNKSELLSLHEATALLRRHRKPRHPQSLYDRIRRGTLTGIQQNGKWYIPRRQVEQLLREPYHRRGGRPRIQDTAMFVQRKPRRQVEIHDAAEVMRMVELPVPKRSALALRAHVLVRNAVRARLELQYPRLSRREINLKVVEELSRG